VSTTPRNTIITLIGNLLTLLIGMLLVISVGHRFGVGWQMDAFWLSNTLPNVLGQVFLSLSLLVLTPTFIRRRADAGEGAAWKVANTYLSGTVVAGLITSLVLIVGAPVIVRLLAPGFEGQTALLSQSLLRTLSITVCALAITGTISSLLMCHHRFAVVALTRPLSLVVALVVVSLATTGSSVHVYAWALVGGSVLGTIVTVGALFPYRRHMRPGWAWQDPSIAPMFGVLPVILIARGMDHGNQLVTRAIASSLPAGSISALGYAWVLFQVPGLLGASLGTVIYPQFAEKLARGDHEDLVRQVVRSLRIMLIMTCPLAVYCICLSTPIIQVLFERGSFAHHDTILTAKVLTCYGIGILATSLNAVIGNLYWSMELVRQRVALEAAAILLCIIISLVLAPRYGSAGLAVATSIMYLSLTVIGILLLRNRFLRSSGWNPLLPSVLRTVTIGSVMAIVVVVSYSWASSVVSSLWATLGMSAIGGGAIYMVLTYIAHREDARDVLRFTRQALVRA
jgi:putative peptidoglycan lipid II flippase